MTFQCSLQIDVHYSLPRDDSNSKGGEKNQVDFYHSTMVCLQLSLNTFQEMQGVLLVTLRNSVSGQAIDDNEVRRKFQQFGDVKDVRPANDRSECVVRLFPSPVTS